MASKKIAMYAEKQYELEEIKNGIKVEFDKHTLLNIEFKDEIDRELGETKTLLKVLILFLLAEKRIFVHGE